MKKIVFLVAFLALAAFASTGYAQVKAGAVYVSPTLGGYMFEGNEDMDNSLSLGLRAGYNFTKYFGLEGFVHYVPTDINTPEKGSLNFVGYGIEGIFNILPDRALVPFLAVGVGGVHYSNAYERTTEDKKNKIAVDYGAGVKYFLTENFALRGDVRHVIPFDGIHSNLLYTVGLVISFGGASKAVAAPLPVAPVAPAVIDSDKDGVPDDRDKCPGTPAGVAVDQDGCPLDSDKDGVPDYLDKCPGTPAGVKVDKDGCPPPVVQEVKKEAAVIPVIIEKGKVTLNVQFDTNKATIKKGFYDDVDELGEVMKQYPDINVEVDGHTDNVGSVALNNRLSQARADAVVKYLVEKHGIEASRLTAKGFGFSQPVASNATAEGRAQNRRVEAVANYIIKE
ncbi:MAG: OmpA family protein [Smithellaceae bacterium]